VWFGGFSGTVIDGDSRSPLLSSYIFFSQLVEEPSDITKCYQDGDPTSKEFPDILATDGGYLRISGAYGIVGMKTLSDSLIILATNGIWRVTGGDAGFDATDYMVSKISDTGCSSPNSITETDQGVVYWGEDGIYYILKNELGDFIAQNLTQQSIQTRYNDISSLDKKYASGYYDAYDRKIRWLYGNRLESTTSVEELVFDLNLGAFLPNSIPNISGNRPKPMCLLKVPPFSIGGVSDKVLANGVEVEANGVPVVVSSDTLQDGVREVVYITLLEDSVSDELQYTMALYGDTSFLDWVDFDTVGVDAAGYMVTGALTGGDTQREKTLNYLTFHMERTEDGFEADVNGDLTPTNQSSCLVQSQWEWTNSANSNRWSREFQAYRYRRLYMPTDVNDPYDTGHSIITTKNKIRGRGRALSFLMKTEPGKDCRILGWSMIIGVEGNV